ncbi:MAG: ATP-dependent Clp protease ATP-binding subunit [Candidatus Saccharibacteria bacterium]
MNSSVNLNSYRAKKARLSKRFGQRSDRIFVVLSLLFVAIGGFLIFSGFYVRIGYLAISLGLTVFIWALWTLQDLKSISPSSTFNSLDDILEVKLLASLKKSDLPLNPQKTWAVVSSQWESRFMCNRLLIIPDQIGTVLSDNENGMVAVLQMAGEIMAKNGETQLNSGILTYALIACNEPALHYLATNNLSRTDLYNTLEWMGRINHYIDMPKPYFGGIGRDWATGFTPTLEQYGQNISNIIEAGGENYHTLAHNDVLDTIVYNLGSGAGSLALVGEAGTGKTSLVYALAERLLEGKDNELQHYQIFSLNASMILSQAGNRLEQIILALLTEAVHAGNIILFLDEAHLFFGGGTGAFDLSQVLQPVISNRRIKIIVAFTPNDYQKLKIANESLAASFAMVTINEPEKPVVMDVLEDSALTLEYKSGLMVSYEAVRDAFRLSGQYMQEAAYPGKAINLLDQAAAYSEDKIITAQSVALAVEKIKGVRVSGVKAPEADILLNLEERIHSRMINQARAVKVVSAALRRTRAGVTSGKRPVGSFLFLGPTGVGKTELARSLADIYFGDENQMIRLDMSEYQQTSDVSRLLSDGADSDQSLILAIRKQPFSVVLLDEIEKSHPSILNLLLQMLDEGKLTDSSGKAASFASAIIIATSNAGSALITEQVVAGKNLEDFERPFIDQLIASNQFKPELINRFDEIVLFRPLNQAELGQVAVLMINEVNKTLTNKNISVALTEAALAKVVAAGYDPVFGARPMRRTIQKMIEDALAVRILKGDITPGQAVTLDVNDLADQS